MTMKPGDLFQERTLKVGDFSIEDIARSVYEKRYPFLAWRDAPYKTQVFYKMVVEEVIKYLKKK